MIKRLISVIVLALMLGAFSGCSPKKNSGSDAVTLKWVLGGPGKQQDSDMVWAEFNKKLKEKMPDTQIEFEIIPFADYAEKWKLMAASREQVDIAWTGYVMSYEDEVRKGSYLEINDLLDEYAKDLKEEIPPWVLDKFSINGKYYSVPNYQMMVTLPWGLRMPKKLIDKYGFDIKKLEQTFEENTPLTKEKFADIEKWLATLKAGGDLNKGVSPTFTQWFMSKMGRKTGEFEAITANASVKVDDGSFKVYDMLYDVVGSETYYEIINDWFKKGYIRKDILTLQDWRKDEGKEDGYVMWLHQAFKGESERESKKYGFPIEVIPLEKYLYVDSGRTATTNTALPITCKDPKKAMQFLNLINSKNGKELYNLLAYGIEDKHYKKISDNRIEVFENNIVSKSDSDYGLNKWAIGNTFNAYETQLETEGWNDYIKNDVNEKATISPLMEFNVNLDNIKLEISQYNAIMNEYKYLETGAVENYKEVLTERNAKLKKAGSDKIVQEIQNQLDVWKTKKEGK